MSPPGDAAGYPCLVLVYQDLAGVYFRGAQFLSFDYYGSSSGVINRSRRSKSQKPVTFRANFLADFYRLCYSGKDVSRIVNPSRRDV
jgi:hypothetical protein